MNSGETSRAIDWEAIHRRLANASFIMETALQTPAERGRAIMDERAQRLARPLAVAQNAAEMIDVVTFRRGTERFALESRYVREVFLLDHVTPVPGTPNFVVGIANLRGEVLAVMDVGMLLGFTEQAANDGARTVLVVGDDRAEFGILVDAVEGLVELRSQDVLNPPASFVAAVRDCLHGMTGAALIVLAGAVLLNDPRLFIDEDGGAIP